MAHVDRRRKAVSAVCSSHARLRAIQRPDRGRWRWLDSRIHQRCTVRQLAGEGPSLSQKNERERVKARIKALAEKTVSNGCTEAEAMAAAEMVGRLLERYALSMDEIEMREARCVQVTVPIGGQRRRPIDGCVPAVARFCDCKVWLERAGNNVTGLMGDGHPGPESRQAAYVFFGFETDTALARYLFTVIDRAIGVELLTFRRANPRFRGSLLRRASGSFQHGMAGRIAERLEEMHRAREAAVGERRATGTALIIAKHRMVEDAFRATDVRLVSPGRFGPSRSDPAFRQGWAAGDRVNLHRPLQGEAQGLLT
ncbi:MAG: DUF2786 domain-containing protein [Verrucomicrobia bacterium]|nr:DUF2786 domain-containing protein [Verrucomicrobiota bacterium]